MSKIIDRVAEINERICLVIGFASPILAIVAVLIADAMMAH